MAHMPAVATGARWARNGHAHVPTSHREAQAIMVDGSCELGICCVERVTGIEPALSAWESDRSKPLTALSWASDAPLVTVIDSATPGLMARQWPVAWCHGAGIAPGNGHPAGAGCCRWGDGRPAAARSHAYPSQQRSGHHHLGTS